MSMPHIPAKLESKKKSSESVLTDQIGPHLRSLYDNVLMQPVPGRFRELLRELEGPSSTLPAHVESFDRQA
jgi:Anti-sigma factor NepR